MKYLSEMLAGEFFELDKAFISKTVETYLNNLTFDGE